VPAEFPDTALAAGELRGVGGEGAEWRVYDVNLSVKDYGGAWVRGVASLSAAEGAMDTLLRLALFALPGLVLIAAVGGWLITRRAFLPVRRIADTAESIGGSGDLSQRIGPPYGRDEMGALARTFDGMFDRLERAFKKERQFTADASHELRTPMAVIMAQSEYGLEHPGEAERSLNVVLKQSQKLSALLHQLLLLARADNKTARLNLETLELSELTELVIEQQQEFAQERGITLHAELQPGLTLRADETMLMRLLINLIQNAIRYGRTGGNVWVSLKKGGGAVVGRVRDDGIGIPKELQPRIWERFYQVEPSRSGDGSGLGLSMVKWIAEAHGGSVRVDSQPGEGSVFEFVLPE